MPPTDPNELASRLAVIKNNAWFRDLPEQALVEFARASSYRKYADGELIVARGMPPEGIIIVIRGAIRNATLTAEGREVVFSLVPPGSLWGLVAAIDGQGAVHDTRAHRHTEVLLLRRTAFLEILSARPQLYRHFAEALCYRLRRAYSAVDEFALVPLRQRLARQLCTLALAEQADGSGASLRLTQTEIAVMLGAARPSVNRELKRMQREGLLELGYRGLTVKQFSRLRQLCETQGIFAS